MNQATLITEIDTVINTNGTQAITGAILNGVLKDMFLNTYSAEIGVGLLPTVVSPVVTATDDLKTVLARIQLNATTGTNGIASIGGVLGLGSDLTQSTTIGGLHTLTLGDEGSNNPLNSFVVHTKNGMSFRNILSGVTNSLSMTANSSFYSLSNATTTQGWAASLGSFKIFAEDVSNDVFIKLHSTGQNVTGNGTDNNIIIQDKISNKGLVYATDYSANFTDESLVTKRWVAAALGAAAGLTATLAIDNKTNGIPIKSNDSNTFLTIINGGATFQSDGNINHNAAQHIFLGNFSAIGGNTGFGFNASSFSIYTGVNKYYTLTSAAATFRHTVKNTFNAPVNEFSNGGAYFVSGIGIDTTATGGTDVLNIGATNANVINYGNSSTTHNFLGTAIYELQVNSYVEDKLITLNYGGSVGSGIGVGFEIEEDSLITGFLKTNATRDGFSFQAPSIVHTAHFLFSSFTADRTFDLPDSSGTLSLQSYVDAKVTDSITDGITTVAPSQNAVFDALITKADKQNGLVNGGTITVGTYGGTGTNNDIRVAAATWFISPSNYSTAGNTDFLDITLAATGLQRYVGFYGDNTNTITMVDGVESTYAAYPSTPVGKALIGYVLVTDSAASAAPDLSGYMLIASKATSADVITGTDNTKYLTSSVIQGIVAKYQNLSTTTSTSLTTTVDNYRDTFHSITALASAMTINAPTGTPTNGTKLWYRIKDNGTARTLTWGVSFVSRGATLPTTTVISKVLNVGFSYNSVTSTWDCVAVINEA